MRSHFLVKEGVRINGQGNSNPTLSMDQIDKTAKRWKKADILVFNTGHWWTHGKTARGYVCMLISYLHNPMFKLTFVMQINICFLVHSILILSWVLLGHLVNHSVYRKHNIHRMLIVHPFKCRQVIHYPCISFQ